MAIREVRVLRHLQKSQQCFCFRFEKFGHWNIVNRARLIGASRQQIRSAGMSLKRLGNGWKMIGRVQHGRNSKLQPGRNNSQQMYFSGQKGKQVHEQTNKATNETTAPRPGCTLPQHALTIEESAGVGPRVKPAASDRKARVDASSQIHVLAAV